MFLRLLIISVALAVCHAQFEDVQSASGSLNVYYAYTRDTKRNIEIFNGDPDSIKETTLSADRNVLAVVVHGHEGTAFTSLNPAVKEALLEEDDNNVVVVDWSQYSLQSYSNAVGAVPGVGTALAELIQDLITEKITTLDKVHLIGFGLGAHVVGYAGRTLKGEVGRITGLDPSRDQWGKNSKRLSIDDAKYVEVIHTDSIGLFANAIEDAIGNVDIYPNGGEGQPGCLLSRTCSHNRSWELFTASLTHSHLKANQCTSLTQMKWNQCKSVQIPLGNNVVDKPGEGIYRINTSQRFPF